MRKRVRFIMIFVAVAFIAGFLLGELWTVLRGRGEASDPRTRGLVARVGDRNVTAEELRGAIAYNTDRYQRENSLRDLSMQDYEAIENRAWDWLISELTWRKLFEKTGVTVTYDEVLEIMKANPPEELLQDPALRDSAGNFDQQRYLQAVESEQNRAYFSRYFQELAEMLPKEKLRIDMNNSFRVTTGAVEQRRRSEGERVAVTALFFGPRAVGAPVEPTDEEAKKYFDDNPDEFKPRAMRQLAYVHFPLRLSAADSAAAAETAERARAQLEGGESFNLTMLDFTDLVPDTIGDYVPRARLDRETDSVVATLAPGRRSDPYLTPYGWQIITVDSVSGDSVALRRVLIRVKLSSETSAGIRDEVAAFIDLVGAAGFDELAAERGLRVSQVRPLVGDEPELSGLDISNQDAVVKWALKAKPGEVMPTATRGPSGYYVFKLAEYQAATLPEFEAVKRQAQWRAKQQREREIWTARAHEVLAELRAGRKFEAFTGEESGIELIEEEYQSITESRRRRGAEYAGAVKALEPGQVSGVVATNWGAFIVRCERRESSAPEAGGRWFEEMYQQASQRIVRGLLEPPTVEDYRDPLY